MVAAMRTLEGQVALITGAGRGIGQAIALALAAKGVRIIVTGRTEKALGETVGEIVYGGGKARHLAGDVRDPAHLDAAVTRAIETFGGLDIVIANAGVGGRIALGEEPERARAILETNLGGTYNTFAAAAPRMKGPGRLLALSSVLATTGAPGHGAYTASKAGILGLVRATAQELAPKKITCNAIVPGWVDTAMADARLDEIAEGDKTSREAVKARIVSAFPLGRFLEPHEVSDLVLYLVSTAADGITGQAIGIGGSAAA